VQETRTRGGDISFAELIAFAAVVDHGSFSRAAEVLSISQPTVSLRLQNLEERLGLRLLDRRNGILLTDPGRELYNRARQILSNVDAFHATVGDLKALRKGRLRVGFSTPAFAMPALRSLRASNPDLILRLSVGNTTMLVGAIEDCAIDAAIMTLRTPPLNLAARPMAEQRLIGLVAQGSPIGAALDWEGLSRETIIIREPGSMTRELFEDEARRSGLQPAQIIEAPTREATREAAAAGLGVAIVLSGEAGEDARVRQVDLGEVACVGSVYVAASREARNLPSVSAARPPDRAIDAADARAGPNRPTVHAHSAAPR